MTASKIQSRPNTIYNSINSISTSPTSRALGYSTVTVVDVASRLRSNSVTPRRCLFGAPSPGDAQRLYNEQVERDRQRFINRYQFDVMTEKYVGGASPNNTAKTKDSPKKLYNLRQKSGKNSRPVWPPKMARFFSYFILLFLFCVHILICLYVHLAFLRYRYIIIIFIFFFLRIFFSSISQNVQNVKIYAKNT